MFSKDAEEKAEKRSLYNIFSQMLSSSRRLTTSLFKEVMDKGKIFHSPIFILRLVKSHSLSRFSVSVSKKVAKNAVDRNKFRRRAYSAIDSLYQNILPGFHGVFIAKNSISKSSFVHMSLDIKNLFVKIGLLK